MLENMHQPEDMCASEDGSYSQIAMNMVNMMEPHQIGTLYSNRPMEHCFPTK